MKSQTYGLSVFIYAIAISVVLIVGLIGISRDMETFSQNSFQKAMALQSVKSAESFKNSLDSERAYVVDSAIFKTGIAGGYTLQDLSSTNPPSPAATCGVKKVELSFLGEKYVPYWNSLSCVTPWSTIESSLKKYLSFSTMLSSDISSALSAISKSSVHINYIPKYDFSKFESEGIIKSTWIPTGTKYISFSSPPYNPIVTYKFEPFIQLTTKSNFPKLYNVAKDYVSHNFFVNYLSDPHSSPLPLVVDVDVDSAPVTHDQPFKDLLLYVIQSYPDSPNNCGTPPSINSVSDYYQHDCTVVTKVNNDNGLLYIDKYKGYCYSSYNRISADQTAIKYILCKVINNIDKKLSKVIRIDVASKNNGATAELEESDGSVYTDSAVYQIIDDKNKMLITSQESDKCAPPPYDYHICYSCMRMIQGWDVIVSLNDATSSSSDYIINTINITTDGSYADGDYTVMIMGSDNNWEDISYYTKIYPPKSVKSASGNVDIFNLPSLHLKKIKIIANSQLCVIEVDAFTAVRNFKVTPTGFNLTYHGSGSSVTSDEYTAIDIDDGRLAPRDYANPNPNDCSTSTPDGKTAIKTQGESCDATHICCGSLNCCNTINDKNGKCYSDCCGTAGQSCDANSPCCSGESCVDGVCTTQTCHSLGGSCSSSSDCCSGFCNTYNRCDNTGCVLHGDSCDGGSCCRPYVCCTSFNNGGQVCGVSKPRDRGQCEDI